MELVLAIIIWLVVWFAPVAGLLFASYTLVSLPLRRRETARSFLTLVEVNMKEGRSVEASIVSLAEARDPGLGTRFFALAACLRSGRRLSEGLKIIPGILPPQVAAMIKSGEKLGDLRKVMPACRNWLKDSLGSSRSPLNYMLVAAALTTPVVLAITAFLQIFVFPKFNELLINMEVENPTGMHFLMALRGPLLFLQFLVLFIVWFAAFVYIGGPAVFTWSGGRFSVLLQRLQHRVPWRRKRMQRDFAFMLGVLLDAGVPEPEALSLAADCTANEIFMRRAAAAVAALQRGVKLAEAMRLLDDSGEFHWRLANATQSDGGFSVAVAGWVESLDARAFQQEQSAAQVVATVLVLLNGFFAGAVVIGVFSSLVAIINAGNLW